MTLPSDQDWTAALTRAALPGAATVAFTRTNRIEDGTPTTAYSLRSFDAAGTPIGDDRDYDLLKAVMAPLERLAEQSGEKDLSLTLDLNTKMLSRS